MSSITVGSTVGTGFANFSVLLQCLPYFSSNEGHTCCCLFEHNYAFNAHAIHIALLIYAFLSKSQKKMFLWITHYHQQV